jgi:D-serine dehydratase
MDALCENVKVLMNGISEMETPTSLYFFSQALIAGYSIGVTRVNKSHSSEWSRLLNEAHGLFAYLQSEISGCRGCIAEIPIESNQFKLNPINPPYSSCLIVAVIGMRRIRLLWPTRIVP